MRSQRTSKNDGRSYPKQDFSFIVGNGARIPSIRGILDTRNVAGVVMLGNTIFKGQYRDTYYWSLRLLPWSYGHATVEALGVMLHHQEGRRVAKRLQIPSHFKDLYNGSW